MKNKNDLIWGLSLIVIGITALVLSIANIADIKLPDILTRIIGIIDLVAIPVLIYSSFKKFSKKK